MVSYSGRHAEYYDTLYAEKPYVEEAAFVQKWLQELGVGDTGRILDVACGTGNHAFELEKLGYSVVGVDSSQDMLDVARRKAQASSSTVEFVLQDMRSLEVRGAPFDAVICLFDSIGFAKTNDSIKSVLSGVRRHLRPGGLFVFEFWHAAPMLSSYEPVRVRYGETDQGEILRISETELNLEDQLARVTYRIYELRHDGTYAKQEEKLINRFFLLQEMAGFLATSGFNELRWFPGFQEGIEIDRATWHILGIAERPLD